VKTVIHLVIFQPAGYIHSLGFLDSARYLRYQFRRLGYEVTIAKNRVRNNAINIIFGAHIGIPESWTSDYTSVIFNQEQLGEGGASLPPAYLNLLRRSHVLDYDVANIPAYEDTRGNSGLLRAVSPLLYAPYLFDAGGSIALEERPIDILFIGSMNKARQRAISRIESCGVSVSYFDHPMYGPERDLYISQAKATLNIPFYESTRFEQTRVFNSLSTGTPVISLRRPELIVDSAFESAVHWFEEVDLERYFSHQFKAEYWFRLSREQLCRWRENDGGAAYRILGTQLERLAPSEPMWSMPAALNGRESTDAETAAQVIKRLNLSPERGYRPDWVNAGPAGTKAEVDVDLDLESLDASSEVFVKSGLGVHYVLRRCALQEAYLFCRLGRLPSIHQLAVLTEFLEEQGSVTLDVPLGVFSVSDQRPAFSLALIEGQVRFVYEEYLRTLDGDTALELQSCELTHELGCVASDRVHLGRFIFVKRHRSPRELVVARMIRDDFADLPPDNLVEASAC